MTPLFGSPYKAEMLLQFYRFRGTLNIAPVFWQHESMISGAAALQLWLLG